MAMEQSNTLVQSAGTALLHAQPLLATDAPPADDPDLLLAERNPYSDVTRYMDTRQALENHVSQRLE